MVKKEDTGYRYLSWFLAKSPRVSYPLGKVQSTMLLANAYHLLTQGKLLFTDVTKINSRGAVEIPSLVDKLYKGDRRNVIRWPDIGELNQPGTATKGFTEEELSTLEYAYQHFLPYGSRALSRMYLGGEVIQRFKKKGNALSVKDYKRLTKELRFPN